jgi:Uma2 family endonuclease
MSTAELTTDTADNLLHMPEGDRYELVDGQLVEIEPMGARAGWIAGRLFAELDSYSQMGERGWVFPSDAGIRCYPDDPERVRKPDVFFVAPGRLPNEEIPEGFVPVAPHVVVEVISPTDRYYAVTDTVQEYLAAGVKLVWVVHPEQQTIMVHRATGGDPSLLRIHDSLSGEDVLPGFSCPLAAVFPPSRERGESAS